ncbi:G-type lectin S-receptor-like serine/threonine-protein kinase At4g03230 [Bidens hawaiensis]|uniref:G-type lectin S-receptor-like serine/threonine-protein kinase At4g03230 n=1 Tax=Bidens hawaiensis TaxID=980011 RepID=UPI0040495E04
MRTHINELLHLDHSKEYDREGIDVPYFELESIIDATKNFSEENRLGEGGFGLSGLSGQGLQEFKNEVTLIAKLQHINLVRLLGYCIRGEEKLLLYEYMPNRSLDHFVFDRTLCTSLDWPMRFNIIMGIARGLNYLHHDSRLRIIHRDLKTSNVLLDEDMNPKISDFGLAKIVKGKDMEAITNRVVGTFFGVVLLEIINGNRNVAAQFQNHISLLGHAWSLWIEDRTFELLDQILTKSCDSSEVLKCISVGLLCVQGDPDDRPTMTNVIKMLGEGAPLTALKLMDTGNAVLINVTSGRKLWQSFDNPTDTFLPGMKMNANMKLTSWKSATDPGSGSFEFHPNPSSTRYFIMEGPTTYHWKSGKMSTYSFDDNQISSSAFNLLSNATTQKVNNIRRNGTTVSYNTISLVEPNSRLVMGHLGKLQYFKWSEIESQWVLEWEEPKDACSVYKVCGPFGMCSGNNNSLQCSCLPGFEPISPDNPACGCKRTSKIFDNSTKDSFINITMVSMDDTALPFVKATNESECIKECLKNCNCLAYSYSTYQNDSGIWDSSRVNTQGCWFWDTKPKNLKGNGTHNISFRVSESSKEPNINTPSEKPKTERKSSSKNLVLAISFVGSALVLSLFCGIGYITYQRLKKRTNNNQNNKEFMSGNTRTQINELLNLDHPKENDRESLEVPYFKLEAIIEATNNFSEKNRLGQGGFGPVYKGKLPGGEEIAVKRLSSLSGQGLQQFKNEVTLIAKLQHRNLVRLLGYCIKGEEKMLLNEYMPNTSLDKFIFDQTRSASLNSEMRFNIIMGIARGLNYLHHDSRLRIIHRDLKASNILLDEDMNPKISDFGLAKIVKGKDIKDVTRSIFGTFGYMSPEDALDGLFSIKSDVFSFGVVLLEIINGNRNAAAQFQNHISLLGHAWSLWIEDRPFELLDQILTKSCDSSEVLKCISVGLLCVQGDPDDRPTMTNVIKMLGGDMATLPNPKEPAFIPRRDRAISSINMLTITEVAGC